MPITENIYPVTQLWKRIHSKKNKRIKECEIINFCTCLRVLDEEKHVIAKVVTNFYVHDKRIIKDLTETIIKNRVNV